MFPEYSIGVSVQMFESDAIAQGKALELFFNSGLEVVAPSFIIEEFKEHIDEISEKSGLNNIELITFLLLLGQRIRFYETSEFRDLLDDAKNITKDPDDIEYLALALKLNCPIWSEDNGLIEQNKINVITTAKLMKFLKKNKIVI